MLMPTIAILAGGQGTRLYPETREIPKSMVDVAGKPFIAHQIEVLKKNGAQHLVICAGHLGKMIQEYLQREGNFGLTIDFSFDGPQALGTAGAIRRALPLLGEYFGVVYGDSYLTADFKPSLECFLKSKKMALMTVLRNDNQWDKSNTVYEQGHIIAYDKKNLTSAMKYVDYGLLFFRRETFLNLAEGKFYDLADLCCQLVQDGQMEACEVHQRFYEIGSFQGLEETRRYLSLS